MESSEQQEALRRLMSSEAKYVIGVDEVGFGAWAGPLVVAAVVVEKGWGHPDVRDSKKFSGSKKKSAHEKRMTVLNDVVRRQYLFEKVSVVSVEEIDKHGVDKALDAATKGVAEACLCAYLKSVIVVDGNRSHDINGEVVTLSKADDLVPAVSAASILAKVVRDTIMINMDSQYPGYGFAKHKGYGVPVHRQALKSLGICPIHRRSYSPIAALLHGTSQYRRAEPTTG